jgi:hypothetical protein
LPRRHPFNSAGSLEFVIEEIADMPPGTIGFRASGEIDVEEYKRVLVPALERAVGRGRVRLLFEAGPEFEKMDLRAIVADAREGIDLGIRHHEAWERFALATDVEWIARSTMLFAWAMPGEVRVFGVADVEEAKAWLAEGAVAG